MHYVIQSIFVVAGLIALLASLCNWDWFFNAQNSRFVVNSMGRRRARLLYAFIGTVMIAVTIIFFLHVQKIK